MEKVVLLITDLRKSPIRDVVSKRMTEFKAVPKTFNDLFRELVFCILTAGTSADLGLRTISHLGDIIFTGSQEEIQKKLKEVYRFHTLRAGYIFKAKENFRKLDISSKNIRNDLVDNIKGIGMKEASHFLRNVGFDDFAIIDFHIIDLLVKNNLIEKPKTLTKKKYLEIENVLRKLANKVNLSLGELDLYLWFAETGKVLK